MKAISTIIFFVCVIILVTHAIYDHRQLPDTMASHFNGSGVANGWMPRSTFTVIMLSVGIGIPVFVIGTMYFVRFIPARFLNVPNPSYWQEPRNYKKACDFLLMSSLWFGSVFLLWQAFFSHMIVKANQVSPPYLDGAQVVLLTLPLLVFTFSWVVVLIILFLRTDKCRTEPST